MPGKNDTGKQYSPSQVIRAAVGHMGKWYPGDVFYLHVSYLLMEEARRYEHMISVQRAYSAALTYLEKEKASLTDLIPGISDGSESGSYG